jgi:DNA modification methylase
MSFDSADLGPAVIYRGDALEVMRTLPAEAVQCCVTSPPYYGLRDYGVEGQIGLEETPEKYVGRLVELFAEVRRVLRADGTLWLNLGDSYVANGGGGERRMVELGRPSPGALSQPHQLCDKKRSTQTPGLKPKDLMGIPWRVAFALQADGWYLRSDIIWSKPNPMPESVTDRPTKAHEYVFLLSKSERYAYDADAIKEKAVYAGTLQTFSTPKKSAGRGTGRAASGNEKAGAPPVLMADGRNARSVWTITTQPCPEAHFAVMPKKLARRCILAGCPEGGTVLDPFTGAGTTGLVAIEEGRRFVGSELNPDYLVIARRRMRKAVLADRSSLFPAFPATT